MTKENKFVTLKINVVFSWDFYIKIEYFMDIKITHYKTVISLTHMTFVDQKK